MTATRGSAERAAREARDHPALDRMARVGFVVYGIVYLLIGWLAAQLGFGHSAGSASGQGAFTEIGQKPLGAVALWLAVPGLAALVIWQLAQAVGGHRDEDGVRRQLARAASVGRAVVLTTFAVLAVRTALGNGGGGGSGGLTGSLLQRPYGPALFVVAGLVILAVAATSAYRGLSDRWRKDIDAEGRTGDTGKAVEVLARVGYVSRALAFGVVAVLVVRAGLEHSSEKSGGLDQAILRYRDEPAGPWLIAVVAFGLGCYGAYHLLRAWFLRAT